MPKNLKRKGATIACDAFTLERHSSERFGLRLRVIEHGKVIKPVKNEKTGKYSYKEVMIHKWKELFFETFRVIDKFPQILLLILFSNRILIITTDSTTYYPKQHIYKQQSLLLYTQRTAADFNAINILVTGLKV